VTRMFVSVAAAAAAVVALSALPAARACTMMVVGRKAVGAAS
jgi:hypothetical protein